MPSRPPLVEQRREASVRRDPQPQEGHRLDHRWLGRAAIALAVLSAGVHGALAAEASSRSMTTAWLLVGMAAAWLTCTRSLWRGGAVQSWMTMLGITGVLLYAHWSLCFACGPAVHESVGRSGLPTAALVLMALELAVATAAVVRLLVRPQHNIRENNREVALP